MTTYSSQSGSVTVPWPQPTPPPPGPTSGGGPLQQWRNVPGQTVYGPGVVPNTAQTPGTPSPVTPVPVPGQTGIAGTVSAINTGAGNFISDIVKAITDNISLVTATGANFAQQFNAAIQPISQAAWDIGQTASYLGYLGLALDKKDRLGLSKVVDVGEAISKGAGKASATGQRLENQMVALASGKISIDPAKGAARYQQLKQAKSRKKKRKAKQTRKVLRQATGGSRFTVIR